MSEVKEIVLFNKIKSGLESIKEQGNFLPDMTTDEGYKASKDYVLKVTTKARTRLESARKDAKDYWIKGGKELDAEAKSILSKLVGYEKSHMEAYKKRDTDKKLKKETFENELQVKIDFFSGFLIDLSDFTQESIESMINSCGEVDTTEGFYNRSLDAAKARSDALDYLQSSLIKAVNRDIELARVAEIEKQNKIKEDELNDLKLKMEAQQKDLDAKQALIDAKEDEKQKAIDDKWLAIENDAYRIDAEFDRQIQVEITKAREAERVAAEKLHKKEMAELKVKQDLQQKEEAERLEKERVERENKLRAGRTKNRNTAAKYLVEQLDLTKEQAISVMNLQATGSVPFVTTDF